MDIARGDGEPPEPLEWLTARWKALYPQLPLLESFLQKGRALLLLDALNEMPHKNAGDYHARVGQWRAFTQEVVRAGNRVVFSCRSLDYSATLSGKELRVPQVEAQPMTPEQMRDFLQAYAPAHEERIWDELNGKPQFGLFQTPYFLKLLCELVEATGGDVPKGRAGLFAGFIRQALQREITGELFQPGALLDEMDHRKLNLRRWSNPFDLPERGALNVELPHFSVSHFSVRSVWSDRNDDHSPARLKTEISESVTSWQDKEGFRRGRTVSSLRPRVNLTLCEKRIKHSAEFGKRMPA